VQVAIEEDILVFISYMCVTYTMMVIICVVVVKIKSSDNLFPLKQLPNGIVMNIYCLHQEYMVIRTWYVW
jgi:hypothetical protein